MLQYVYKVQGFFLHTVSNLDSTQWFWITIAVCAVGFICMRGFGSRTNY